MRTDEPKPEQLGEIVARCAQVVPHLVAWFVVDPDLRERCGHEDNSGRCPRQAPWFVGIQMGEPNDDGGWWRYGDYCATHWMHEFMRWSDRIAPEEE